MTRKKIINLTPKKDGCNGIVFNSDNFAVQITENDQGIIVDVFQRDGDLIETQTYWNYF
jgi:hypothetical protein